MIGSGDNDGVRIYYAVSHLVVLRAYLASHI
jgi:hypothetical protein